MMCRACQGQFPTTSDHRFLSNAAAELRLKVKTGRMTADDPNFVAEIVKLDRLRFDGAPASASPEWGHPQTAPATRRLIFSSTDPHALTLFVLACWYDAQEQYVTVWSRRLEQLAGWIRSREKSAATLPSARSGPWTRSVAWKTWDRCNDGGFASWFASRVRGIAEEDPSGRGNVHRFIGCLAKELANPGQTNRSRFETLEAGRYAPAQFKRAWMLTMFLRRDQGIVRCLIERALSRLANGGDVASAWYDDRLFPQVECELPVDSRMREIGTEIFGTSFHDDVGVMDEAHAWGERHALPPSTLDALFFAMD